MVYGDNEDMMWRMMCNDAWQGYGAIVSDGKIMNVYFPTTSVNESSENRLPERVSGLEDYLTKKNEIQLKIKLPKRYEGIIDSTFSVTGQPRYFCAIDKLHEKHQSWDSCVLVKGNTFRFSHQEFSIKGKIIDAQELCNFECYLINVEK